MLKEKGGPQQPGKPDTGTKHPPRGGGQPAQQQAGRDQMPARGDQSPALKQALRVTVHGAEEVGATNQRTPLCSTGSAIQKSSSFTPEKKFVSAQISYRFRCPGPGVFQCTETGLVFGMAQGAELMYSIDQWDKSRLEPAGKLAAGPLFNIQCSEGAVRQLHFPHCETKDDPTGDTEQRVPPEKWLSLVRIDLVQRLSDIHVGQLLDRLLDQEVITTEEMDVIRETTGANKTRDMIDGVIKKGPRASKVLTMALPVVNKYLFDYLDLKHKYRVSTNLELVLAWH